MSAAPANTLDNAYNAAQRANAILALIFDGFIDSIPNENVQTALYAVQREVNEVLGIVEALNWPEDQAPDSDPAAGAKAEPAGDCARSSGAGLFDKLLRFAESITEEAAGIDVELRRYREGLSTEATDTASTDNFLIAEIWADARLLANGNRYRLIDNTTNEITVEFNTDTLDQAKDKCVAFIRYGNIDGGACSGRRLAV